MHVNGMRRVFIDEQFFAFGFGKVVKQLLGFYVGHHMVNVSKTHQHWGLDLVSMLLNVALQLESYLECA